MISCRLPPRRHTGPAILPASMLPPRRSVLHVVLAALLLSAASGCERRDAAGTAPPVRNVILILVDRLRADHTSLYGYARDTTPELERRAGDGVVFERARSQSACTFPSVNSLLTSRHPAIFFHQGFRNFSIPPGVPSIAEVLKAKGYTTLAVSSSAIVRATPTKHNEHGGYDRGFDAFDESCLWEDAACVNRRALALLDKAREPFFIYLHYLDPHAPYAPPKSHRLRFAKPFVGDPRIAQGQIGMIERTVFRQRRPDLVSQAAIRHLIDLYDEEIAYFDEQLARLLEALEEHGLLDDTLVVLTADHAEEFLEHGSVAHCRTTYDTETRIPLVFWAPGRPGGRIATPVENLDVVPTILDFLAVEPPPGMDGKSLRPWIERREQPGSGVARSLQTNLRSIDDGR